LIGADCSTGRACVIAAATVNPDRALCRTDTAGASTEAFQKGGSKSKRRRREAVPREPEARCGDCNREEAAIPLHSFRGF
jgi:hypothetical protein